MSTLDLLVGCNPELDMPTAIDWLAPEWIDRCQALITMVDSSEGVATLISLAPLLAKLGLPCTELDGDILTSAEALRVLSDEHEFFNGFDEVWLFEETPRHSKPSGVRLTSDRQIDEHTPLEGLAAWMRESRCLAGLGDGIGLNFATFNPELATLWQAQGP